MVDVRPLRVEDIEDIVDVHMGGWLTAYRGIVADEILDGLDRTAWLKRYRDQAAGDRPWQTFVAVGERPLGHVSFGPYREQDSEKIDPAVGEILSIYIDSSVYGTGIGGQLMTAALEMLPQREVRLWVLEENRRARRFYEKYGLRPDGEREIWFPRGSTLGYPEIRYSITR
jgi:ribosomal protein S18 acetylase RimI-like enzyme